MFLILFGTVIYTAVNAKASSSSSSTDVSIEDLTSILDNISSDESRSEERRDMKEYYKWMFKEEKRYLAKKMRKEISQEEINQVKYFENILKNVKNLGKSLGK